MHIHVDDQETGATLVLCVERETRTCVILRGDITLLERALSVASSMKVGVVRMIVHTNAIKDLEAQGWRVVPEHVVVERRYINGSTKGVNPDGEFQTPGGLMR